LHPGSFLLIDERKWTVKIKFSSKILKFYEPHCLRRQIYFILDMNVKRHGIVKTVGYYPVGDHISRQTETW